MPWFVSDREVYGQQEFRTDYEGVGVRIPTLDTIAVFYVRRDFKFQM
jgi:hypothetical protein